MRKLWVFGAAFVLVNLVNCGDDLQPGGDTGLPDDVIYDGDASDEALEVVFPRLAGAQVSAELAIATPAPGTTLGEAPPVFTWGALSEHTPGVLPPASPRAPGWPGISLGVRRAAAHLPPVTGHVYLLELESTGRASPLYVFTTNTSYALLAADWDSLRQGGGTLSVRLYGAYLNRNSLEDGPFRGEAGVSYGIE